MKKNMMIGAAAILILIMVVVAKKIPVSAIKESYSLDAESEVLARQTEKEERLGQYALNMMARTSGKSMSNSLKLSLARAMVRVASDILESVEAQRAWVAVIAIESGFNRLAQSPTGPKGYGQLAKAAFHEALKDCGMNDIKDDDVWDTELNLYASACYFRKMLEQSENDPFVAIVRYNQGPNSEAAKQYAKHGTMDNTEALKYVAKLSFLKRKVTDEKISPAIIKEDSQQQK